MIGSSTNIKDICIHIYRSQFKYQQEIDFYFNQISNILTDFDEFIKTRPIVRVNKINNNDNNDITNNNQTVSRLKYLCNLICKIKYSCHLNYNGKYSSSKQNIKCLNMTIGMRIRMNEKAKINVVLIEL